MVSFPLDENIYLYNKLGEMTKKSPMKSKFIDQIKPMRGKGFLKQVAERKTLIPDVKERAEYLWSTSYYAYIFRLEKTKINVRVNFLNKPNRKFTDYSVILFNDDFKLLGEQEFDGEIYLVDRFFIVDDIVYIMNDKKTYSADDEKYMYFDGFKITK